MSSSIEVDDIEYIGFAQKTQDDEIGIGMGLTEGYTQLLTERFIEKAERYIEEEEESYPVSQFFTKQVENIIGQKNMEKLYFKADLQGLISSLERYNTRDNIIKFICQLDIINSFEMIYNSEYVDIELIHYYFKKAFKDMSNFVLYFN